MQLNQQIEANGMNTNHEQTANTAPGGNNPLEQETFSMQQDTFQVDPNQQ